MCAIFGFLDYGKNVSASTLKRLLRALSVAAESRGTDATGISYVNNGNIVTFKKAKPAHKVKLYFPKDTTAVIGHMLVSTGALDYQTAVRRAIQAAAEEGAFVLYPSGHRDRLDVAVRRSVLTGVGQTVRKLSEINAGDMDCDLMEITAHAGARPDHAEWQGMLVSLSGKNAGRVIDGVRVLSLKEIGYGTGEGFGGWNCRHDWYPYFEGISHRAYTDARLKALNEPHIDLGDGKLYTDYEVSQMQRALEREVRAAKRQVAAANAAVESAPDDAAKKAARADFTVQSVRLKAAEKELHDFCGQTGFREDGSRVWVNGFGRSVSQKAVWADRKNFVKMMKQKGIKNPPKSLAKFEEMRYNNPMEYQLMTAYIDSVDRGMLSSMVGYDLYKEYHNRIQNEIVGLTAADGTVIRSQSKHFLERVFGTIDDPSHGGVMRTGVELDDVIDAVKNGQPVHKKNHVDSITLVTGKCIVSINTKTGNLIQVTPK